MASLAVRATISSSARTVFRTFTKYQVVLHLPTRRSPISVDGYKKAFLHVRTLIPFYIWHLWKEHDNLIRNHSPRCQTSSATLLNTAALESYRP